MIAENPERMKIVRFIATRVLVQRALVFVQCPENMTDRQVQEAIDRDGLHSLNWRDLFGDEAEPDRVEVESTSGPARIDRSPNADDDDTSAFFFTRAGILDGKGRLLGDPICQEPREDQWTTWRGHRWASNGTFVVREDGPRPPNWVEWRGPLRPEVLEGLFGKPHPIPLETPSNQEVLLGKEQEAFRRGIEELRSFNVLYEPPGIGLVSISWRYWKLAQRDGLKLFVREGLQTKQSAVECRRGDDPVMYVLQNGSR